MTTNLTHRVLPLAVALGLGCGRLAPLPMSATYDVLIRNGTVVDGSGAPPIVADVAISGDRIAALGTFTNADARLEINARGLAVAPGFINMLSWATESLIADGAAQSDLRQGVTLEVMGEGNSLGPLNAAMKRDRRERQTHLRYEVAWTTLGEYLDHLVRRGVAVNVASFVGATTVRVHELGYADRAPTPAELARMQELVRQAMAEGALGVASALIYAPACYAKTDELIALCRAMRESDGLYITHLRSEGNDFLNALDEALRIARETGVRTEIYHLKAAGEANWPKLDSAIASIEAARAQRLPITADMYTYTAAGTGLDATLPPWVQEGGFGALCDRLRDPAVRERLRREMRTPSQDWENFLLAAGSPERIRLTGFKSPALQRLLGRTLADVARERGATAEDTILDLLVEDGSNIDAVYFLMSEDNLRRQLKLPWVSFGSDEAALSLDPTFAPLFPHPRAYGNFVRFLGRYVREERLVPLEEAIRRLTSLPAANLKLDRRGTLKPGYFADIVVLDPATIADRATYERPHQYAVGVHHVFVNGIQALKNGEPTGARPGQVVRGPGYRPGR